MPSRWPAAKFLPHTAFEPRGADDVRPGFFALRDRRGKRIAHPSDPWVPCRIYYAVARDPVTGEELDRSPQLVCEVNGNEGDLLIVWRWGRELTEDQFLDLSILGIVPHD